jgi:hypothetical protein
VLLDFIPPIHPPLVGILDPTGSTIHSVVAVEAYSGRARARAGVAEEVDTAGRGRGHDDAAPIRPVRMVSTPRSFPSEPRLAM